MKMTRTVRNVPNKPLLRAEEESSEPKAADRDCCRARSECAARARQLRKECAEWDEVLVTVHGAARPTETLLPPRMQRVIALKERLREVKRVVCALNGDDATGHPKDVLLATWAHIDMECGGILAEATSQRMRRDVARVLKATWRIVRARST